MKLKIIIENTVFQPTAKGELGFCLFIETDDKHTILFDTGQSGLFAENAKLFDIDIAKIDCLVLSHGHYDHTGGLRRFLELNDTAEIYAKPLFDEKKYSRSSRYIGIPQDVKIPKHRLNIVTQKTGIAEGVFVMPEIPIRDTTDTHFSNLQVLEEAGFQTDVFNDEQYLAIIHNNKLSIVSGCAHRGITNIIESAREHFPQKIDALIGGFHTLHEDERTIRKLSKKLETYEIERIIACHCTGIDQYAQLKSEYHGTVEYGHVGMNIFI